MFISWKLCRGSGYIVLCKEHVMKIPVLSWLMVMAQLSCRLRFPELKLSLWAGLRPQGWDAAQVRPLSGWWNLVLNFSFWKALIHPKTSVSTTSPDLEKDEIPTRLCRPEESLLLKHWKLIGKFCFRNQPKYLWLPLPDSQENMSEVLAGGNFQGQVAQGERWAPQSLYLFLPVSPVRRLFPFLVMPFQPCCAAELMDIHQKTLG